MLLVNDVTGIFLSIFHWQIDERLQTYLDAFDIVLVNDQTMDVPNAIVKRITSNNHL